MSAVEAVADSEELGDREGVTEALEVRALESDPERRTNGWEKACASLLFRGRKLGYFTFSLGRISIQLFNGKFGKACEIKEGGFFFLVFENF